MPAPISTNLSRLSDTWKESAAVHVAIEQDVMCYIDFLRQRFLNLTYHPNSNVFIMLLADFDGFVERRGVKYRMSHPLVSAIYGLTKTAIDCYWQTYDKLGAGRARCHRELAKHFQVMKDLVSPMICCYQEELLLAQWHVYLHTGEIRTETVPVRRSIDTQNPSFPLNDLCDGCPTCVQRHQSSSPPVSTQERSSNTPSVDEFFYDSVDNPSSPPTSSGNRVYDYFYGDNPTPDSSQSTQAQTSETANSQTVFTYDM